MDANRRHSDPTNVPERVYRLERSISDIVRRIDVYGAKTDANERAVDKLTGLIDSQRELRAEKDRRFEDRITALDEAMEAAIKAVKETVTDFITESRKAASDQREFSRRIAIIAITTACSATAAFIGFLVTRGFNAGGG